MAGYLTANTLTENGAVKRGICRNSGNHLTGLIESSIEKVGDKIIATPLDGNESFEVDANTLVSMNMFAFKIQIFDYLEKRFRSFLLENKESLDKCEYLIPVVVFEQIKNGDASCEILKTTAVWHGMTYREDKDDLVNAIKKLTDNGDYPRPLWK